MISSSNTKKFKTRFIVRISLLSLYLALTFPMQFIVINDLQALSCGLMFLGFFIILAITSEEIEISDQSISYKTNFISNTLGKRNWKILWKDIKTIKSLPTSQGSSVYYFITKTEQSFLMPQRINNFEEFKLIVFEKINTNNLEINYLSPLWTYKLLTSLSCLMIIGEVYAYIY